MESEVLRVSEEAIKQASVDHVVPEGEPGLGVDDEVLLALLLLILLFAVLLVVLYLILGVDLVVEEHGLLLLLIFFIVELHEVVGHFFHFSDVVLQLLPIFSRKLFARGLRHLFGELVFTWDFADVETALSLAL